MLGTAADIRVIGEVATGEEALAAARELRPHVILMDIRLSGMDGLEATRRIREDRPETAVIMLTSFENEEYLARAKEVGAQEFLLKGVARQRLLEAIRRARDAVSPPSAQEI